MIVRLSSDAGELDLLEPLWNALQEHHARITPSLAAGTPARAPSEAWARRRTKYERWLLEPDSFFALAEEDEGQVGYAFVTVGPGYASWATGDRLAELETLSVLPESRGSGVGSALLGAVRGRLAEIGVDEIAITTTTSNVDSQRFYERHGFGQRFVVYYGKQG